MTPLVSCCRAALASGIAAPLPKSQQLSISGIVQRTFPEEVEFGNFRDDGDGRYRMDLEDSTNLDLL